ncbi:FliG C-terminal domain-containing protein [Halobacteriovorax sp.]|uniref:FliG C-terminal domain-containing protein n=1 Tax=Halobacteriovorax sp. TaxID=2020862 RepID=UPI003563FAEE
MKMWSTYRKDIIKEKLLHVMESGESVTVWQNRGTEKIKFSAKFLEVTDSTTTIHLEDGYTNADYQLTKDNPIFIHYAKEDYLFKKEAFKTDGLDVIMKTPVELMMRERRTVERFSFKYQDYKNVSLKVGKDENIESISCILKDLSVNGLSLVIHERESAKFLEGSTVYVSAISDQNLSSGVLATICYITPYFVSSEKGSELFKMGLKFNDALESVIFKSINTVISKKQIKQKGLEVSTFNGLSESELEKVLRKISEDNLALANNIREQCENIDRLRYMTLEMKRMFLLEVNLDLLAASLRLATKELVYDLISEVTDTMREEFLFKLDQPKSPSAINKAQDEIVKFIRMKERAGELVLDPTSYEILV